MENKAAEKFLDEFSKLQEELIQIIFDFTNGKVDAIYIYCANEGAVMAYNAFVKKADKILTLNQINDISEEASSIRLYGIEILEKMVELCNDYSQEIPTQIKIVYDVSEETMDADYSYDLQFTNTKDITAYHIFNDWYEEEREKNK